MLWHHFFVILSISLAWVSGYAACGLVALTLLAEMSTLFLNYRAMYSKEELGQMVPSILMLLTFVFYTVFRMILMPFCFYLFYMNLCMVYGDLSFTRKFAVCSGITQLLALYLLNCYWYIFALKAIGRVIGCVKSSDSYQKCEGDEEN